jgi:hypothetical protein
VIERHTHGQDARATGMPLEFTPVPDMEKIGQLISVQCLTAHKWLLHYMAGQRPITGKSGVLQQFKKGAYIIGCNGTGALIAHSNGGQ